jgi:hypothetical protein
MAEIYIQKLNDQSAHSEEEIVQAVKRGKLLPNDLACLRGMNEWKPLYEIVELPLEILESFDAKAEKEYKLLTIYLKKLEETQQMWITDEHNLSLQREFENNLNLFQKQVYEFKQQFPNFEEGKFMESMLFLKHALLKIGNKSYFRRASNRSETMAGGIITGMIANRQEKNNLMEAIKIVDSAISIHNNSLARMMKASLLVETDQKDQAIQELNYIIATFSDNEETYFEARQMKDALENPPKKSGCFIATAAYGSPLAPEVMVFRWYRDEILLRSKIGIEFVKFYYLFSPPIALLISKIGWLKTFVRIVALNPLLKLLKAKKQERKDHENL